LEARLAPFLGALINLVSMRAGFAHAKFFDQPSFHILGDGVLQPLRFIVNFVPLHSQQFVKQSLHQVMPEPKLISDSLPRRGQGDPAFAVNLRQFIPAQAPQSQCYGGRAHPHPSGKGGGKNRAFSGMGLRDGLQIILFRYGEFHGWQPCSTSDNCCFPREARRGES
jgi:hypothetical protein